MGAIKERMSAAAIILAGGLSTRIGKDKATLPFDGGNLAELSVDRLGALFSQIILVTNSPRSPVHRPELEIVRDEIPYLGPLGGIAAGLSVSNFPHSFVAACDMPFLNMELIRYLVSLAPGWDIVLPVTDRPQSLHAVYSKSCLEVISRRLAAGEYRIRAFFDQVKVREVSEEAIRRYDPELLSFFNINTESDYARAREIFRGSA